MKSTHLKRLVPLVVLVVVATAFAVHRFGSDGPTAAEVPDEVLIIEDAVRRGDRRAAEQKLGRVADGLPAGWAPYLRGLLKFGTPEQETGIVDLELAHEHLPDEFRVLDLLFASLLAADRFTDATNVAEQFASSHPADPRALWMAAVAATREQNPDRSPQRALEFLDRFDPARAAAGDTIPLGVHPSSVLEMRARCLSEVGRHLEAVQVGDELVELAPGLKSAWIARGDAGRLKAVASGAPADWADAIEAYRRAVELPPQTLVSYLTLADALLQTRGFEEEALALTEHLLKTAPPEEVEVRIVRARACVRSDEPKYMDEAVDLYREVLRIQPERLEVLRNLGVLLYDWKQGGQDGAYLDEAYSLLRRYQILGGTPDGLLLDVMDNLIRMAQERGVKLRDAPPERDE